VTDLDLAAIKERAGWLKTGGPPATIDAMMATAFDVPAVLTRIAELEAEIRQGRARFQVLVDQHRADLDATNTAYADERDRLQARLDTATAHVEELRGQRDEARRDVEFWRGQQKLAADVAAGIADLDEEAPALRQMLRQERGRRKAAEREVNVATYERDTMRQVVEKADAWAKEIPNNSDLPTPGEYALIKALEAWRYRPAQNTPSGRLSATQADDQGADDGAGTKGSQAQRGVQGDAWRKAKSEDENAGALIPGEGDVAEEPTAAPADPAGLDAAIEAALVENPQHRITVPGTWGEDYEDRAEESRSWSGSCGASGRRHPMRHVTEVELRAAAPHLRAAALNEAADEIDRYWSYAYGGVVAWRLRERAGREAT